MNYIYCITNLINNKRYVGKTTLTVEERFKEHCKDSKRSRYNKRPLYDAMNKYGIENFKIEVLEEVENESILSEREVFWILELHTYGSSGYNASKGGDGTILYDYNEIVDLYNLGYSSQQISEKIGCCKDTIFNILKSKGIKIRGGNEKRIDQFDLAGNFILSFVSGNDAIEWLNNYAGKNIKDTSSIRRCCSHKLKTAYGYIWEYGSLPNL